MDGYTRDGLDEGETDSVAFPAAAEAPDLMWFPELEDGYGEAVVSMDQQVNDGLYEVGDDDNPIHYDDDYAAAFGDAAPYFDVPEGETVVQGSAFVYEAIRNADAPVDSLQAQFRNPVFTGRDVRIERESTEGGEQVSVYDVEDGDLTAQLDLTYGDADMEEFSLEEVNTAKAVKPPRAVGADDQLNNLLLGMEADLGPGKGVDIISHDRLAEVEGDAPYNREDTFSYLDGTEVDIQLLEPDEEVEEAVATRYEELQGETVEEDDPAVRAVRSWTESWTTMMEAWTEMTRASIEAGAEMSPPYTSERESAV